MVVPAGSCATMIRVFWPELFEVVGDHDAAARARHLAQRTKELSELLVDRLDLPAAAPGLARARRLPPLLPHAARAPPRGARRVALLEPVDGCRAGRVDGRPALLRLRRPVLVQAARDERWPWPTTSSPRWPRPGADDVVRLRHVVPAAPARPRRARGRRRSRHLSRCGHLAPASLDARPCPTADETRTHDGASRWPARSCATARPRPRATSVRLRASSPGRSGASATVGPRALGSARRRRRACGPRPGACATTCSCRSPTCSTRFADNVLGRRRPRPLGRRRRRRQRLHHRASPARVGVRSVVKGKSMATEETASTRRSRRPASTSWRPTSASGSSSWPARRRATSSPRRCTSTATRCATSSSRSPGPTASSTASPSTSRPSPASSSAPVPRRRHRRDRLQLRRSPRPARSCWSRTRATAASPRPCPASTWR